MKRYYNIYIWRGVEPQLRGPYKGPEERLEAAVQIMKGEDARFADDSIFKLTIDGDGVPEVYPYAHEELDARLDADAARESSQPKTVTIEFSISGVGNIDIQAESVKEAVEQFAVIDMKELAGRCQFTSFEESGVRIIAIDGEPVQSDLWVVEKELGLKT